MDNGMLKNFFYFFSAVKKSATIFGRKSAIFTRFGRKSATKVCQSMSFFAMRKSF